jgi:hypothetical protein
VDNIVYAYLKENPSFSHVSKQPPSGGFLVPDFSTGVACTFKYSVVEWRYEKENTRTSLFGFLWNNKQRRKLIESL